MNRKLVLWMGVLALTAVPAVSVLAQEGPEDDGPEAEMMDEGGRPEMPGGPGMMPGGPGAGFGAGQGKFGGGPGMNPGMQQMMIKKKMMARGGKGAGGPGFLSEEETRARWRRTRALKRTPCAPWRSSSRPRNSR